MTRMSPNNNKCLLLSAFIIGLMSLSAFAVNKFIFHFPGNNYFPAFAIIPGLYLFFSYAAVRYFLDIDHYILKVLNNIICLYLTFASIAILTNAVQFTPFKPIDNLLVALEKRLHIDLSGLMNWTAHHPKIQSLASISYDSLPWQMTLLPFFVGLFGYKPQLQKFYCLMMISAIIGFGFYYFFPTTAPASIITNPYFTNSQYATGIKFAEIHQHIQPSTIEGGMISLPSFHVIWAWLCCYLALCWLPLFFILLPINGLLTLGCVLLGWHYPVDLVGSLIVIIASHKIYDFMVEKPDKSSLELCSASMRKGGAADTASCND